MWQVVGGWKQEAGALTNSEHLFRERSFAGLRSWREKQASLAWNIFDTRLLRATVSTPMLSPARLCGSSAYSGVMGHLPHARGGEEGWGKKGSGEKVRGREILSHRSRWPLWPADQSRREPFGDPHKCRGPRRSSLFHGFGGGCC